MSGQRVTAPCALEAVNPLEVLQSMMWQKLKVISRPLIFLGAIATSGCYLTHALANNDEPKRVAASRAAPAPARPDDPNRNPAPGRMFVVGRVLDPQGKPVPRAAVLAAARQGDAGPHQ